MIVEEAAIAGFDPLFVLSIIEAESGFNVEAISGSGAVGLMQLLPSTFRAVSTAKRMFDPVENVRAGIRELSRLRKAGFNKPDILLLAYNQGPGGAMLAQTEGVPPEAQAYIPRVLSKYRSLLKKFGKDTQTHNALLASSR